VCDLNLNPDQVIPEADLYGITATTPLVNSAYSLASRLKKSNNYIVLGGPHPTCLPDEGMAVREIDFIVRGEGEETFLSLLKEICGKKKYKRIPGLTWRDNFRIIHNPAGNFITDLDSISFPAFDLFGDISRYSHPQPLIGWRKPVVNIITSRGCPYNCHFCYKGTFGRVWRCRSPENILAEWEMLIKKFNVREIGIQDDCFNIDIRRAKEFAKLVIESKLQLPFSFPNGIRADLLDEELVILLKKAGMYRTAIGVESGNQIVLNDIDKKLDLTRLRTGMTILKKHKIQTIAFFVMGNPSDTEKTMRETIRFAIEISPTFAQFSMATPFPGTRLFESLSKQGAIQISSWDDYSQFDQKGYFNYPDGLSGETIRNWVRKAYQGFYFRPAQLLRIFSLRDFYLKIPDYISGFIHFILKGQ